MTRWFRLYADVLNNPKVQRLKATLFKAWINTLCVASGHQGHLPSISDYSFALRITESEAETILRQLINAGLVDERNGKMIVHDWLDRQFQSDGSTERVKRFRKRQRNVSETANETPPESDTEQNRTEQKESRSLAFAEFWKIYPRKIGRKKVLATYERLVAKGEVSESELLEGARRYAAARAGEDTKFTAHPLTWLNQGRWADENPSNLTTGDGLTSEDRERRHRELCERWLAKFQAGEEWPESFMGPPPGKTGCRVPSDILEKFAVEQAAAGIPDWRN